MIAVFAVFILSMLAALYFDITMILPLALGFVMFFSLAVKKGFSPKEVFSFAMQSLRESSIVIVIMVLIGCLTGLWRQSGTVSYVVSLGISVIPPKFFLLAAFLLSAVMSFALGTSFGVTATAGVILISIARAGGVNPVLAGGAVISGVYVGDRGSPAASSANLVAVLTGTDMRHNIRAMLPSSVVPFVLCCVIYTALSFLSPMQAVSSDITKLLSSEFNLTWYCIIPAVLMTVLPFCNVTVRVSMIISLLSAMAVSVLCQGQSVIDCLKTMVLGYTPKATELSSMLSGGGIYSMLEVCGILIISGTYGGIFRGTGLLNGFDGVLSKTAGKIGRFPLMLIMGFCVSAVFCNQTVGAIMQTQLSHGLYGDSDEEKTAKMLDIENSVILVAGLVPWCIAASVPLGMLNCDFRSLPFAFYLYLVPLLFIFKRR